MSLDSNLAEAKQRVTSEFTRPTVDLQHLASAVDALNKAWDALTDRLVAQRQERDEEISRLLNMLAERRKG